MSHYYLEKGNCIISFLSASCIEKRCVTLSKLVLASQNPAKPYEVQIICREKKISFSVDLGINVNTRTET